MKDPRKIEHSLIAQAAGILASGGLVAFPTDTVYGIGVDALNPRAVGRLFRTKGRQKDQPIPVLLASRDEVTKIARINKNAELLADAFWPGPLTLILKAHDVVPTMITAGSGTVGVRVANHPVPHDLTTLFGGPITGSSANTSGNSTHTTAVGVFADIGNALDMILDSNCGPHSLVSSVVDCTDERPYLLRQGSLSIQSLTKIIPSLRFSDSFTKRGPG